MNRKLLLFGIILSAFALSYAARVLWMAPGNGTLADSQRTSEVACDRLISMAPSLTETVFALGLGDKLVGVTRYCDYPPEAQEIDTIGGFIDPNYEAIAALDPDVVLLLTVHGDAVARMNALGIRTLQFEHRTYEGILESFQDIADTCHVSDAGRALVQDVTGTIDRIHRKTAERPKPRVLVSYVREAGRGDLGQLHIAGRNEWFDNLIQLAGGENAYPDDGIQFPEVSAEAIIRLNPDVVLELIPDLAERGVTREQVIADWKTVPQVDAVKNGRVHVLEGDYLPIPGPRLVQTVTDMARAIHPDVDWGTP